MIFHIKENLDSGTRISLFKCLIHIDNLVSRLISYNRYLRGIMANGI